MGVEQYAGCAADLMVVGGDDRDGSMVGVGRCDGCAAGFMVVGGGYRDDSRVGAERCDGCAAGLMVVGGWSLASLFRCSVCDQQSPCGRWLMMVVDGWLLMVSGGGGGSRGLVDVSIGTCDR